MARRMERPETPYGTGYSTPCANRSNSCRDSTVTGTSFRTGTGNASRAPGCTRLSSSLFCTPTETCKLTATEGLFIWARLSEISPSHYFLCKNSNAFIWEPGQPGQPRSRSRRTGSQLTGFGACSYETGLTGLARSLTPWCWLWSDSSSKKPIDCYLHSLLKEFQTIREGKDWDSCAFDSRTDSTICRMRCYVDCLWRKFALWCRLQWIELFCTVLRYYI